jgi:Tol biopolymer transport system component
MDKSPQIGYNKIMQNRFKPLVWLVLAVVLLLPIFCQKLTAQSYSLDLVPPGYSWRQLETEHFKVIFRPMHRTQAEKCARLAEQVHNRLVPFLKWKPGGRTEIIITDHLDQVNAMANAFPRRTIIIYLSQPAGQPYNYDDWMEELIVHEYAHMLDMDMVSGVPAFLCKAFGRLFLPNVIQPWNQIEGLAVYAESRYTRFGRNNGALYNGILRSYVNENKWPAIDQVTVFGPDWPGGEMPYLFGGKFTQYLADRYGEPKLAEYLRRHSGLVLPFMQNRPAKKTFGQSLPRLWDDWRLQSRRFYRAQIDSIKASGLTLPEKLTADGFEKEGLDVSPDGKYAAYVQSDSRDRARIVLYDMSTKSSRILARGEYQGNLCFSPDGTRLAFAKAEYLGTGNRYYNDLYVLEIASGKTARLSQGLRSRDPAWSADGNSLYFSAENGGGYALGQMDIASRRVKYLTNFTDSCTYSHLKISPDGNRLALAAWTGEGFYDIYVYNIAQAGFQPLFCDQAQELWPGWSKDGKTLYFSSDRSGVWNAYSYDLGQKTIARLTNAIGGLFIPRILDDSTILYLDLSARGYDLVKAETGDYPVPKEVFLDAETLQSAGGPEVADHQFKKYNPLPTMLPVLWFPAAFADEKEGALGASLWGWDALLQRDYYLTAGASPAKGRFYYDLQYNDRSSAQNWSLRLKDQPAAYAVNVSGRDTTYWQREQEQSLTLSRTFKRSGYTFTQGTRYRHVRLSGLNCLINGTYNPFRTGNLCDISPYLQFSNYGVYRNSISPSGGRLLYLRAGFYSELIGSDVDQTCLFGLWNEYLSLPFDRQVLYASFRFDACLADGQACPESNDRFDLRGYDDEIPQYPRRVAATLEYRFPLLNINRGHSTWPVYFKNVHAAAFWDGGGGGHSFGDLSFPDLEQSLGGELVSDLTLFYALPSSVKLGLARTLHRAQKYSLYLTFTQDLLGI